MSNAVLETGADDRFPECSRSKRNWLVRSRAWISITLLVPFAVVALLSPPMVRQETLADFGLDGLAWAVFAIGATFRWWSTFYIGSRKYWDLVTDGPYSMTRNPLYFGTFLIALSIPLFLHSLTFAMGLLFVAPFYLMLTVTWEETCLRERFGGTVQCLLPESTSLLAAAEYISFTRADRSQHAWVAFGTLEILALDLGPIVRAGRCPSARAADLADSL